MVAVGALELPASVTEPGSAVEVSLHGGGGDGAARGFELRARAGHFGRAPGAVGGVAGGKGAYAGGADAGPSSMGDGGPAIK